MIALSPWIPFLAGVLVGAALTAIALWVIPAWRDARPPKSKPVDVVDLTALNLHRQLREDLRGRLNRDRAFDPRREQPIKVSALLAQADALGSGIERVIAERDQALRQVGYALTALMMVRECSPCEKTRALAAGAVETLREMGK